MKQFLKLIEVAKTQGCFTLHKNEDSELYPLEEQDIEFISACQPIVFTAKNKEPVDLKERMTTEVGLVEADLAAPFRVFSIEMVDGPVTGPRPDDAIKLNTLCIMVVEVEPKHYGFYVLMERAYDCDPRIKYYVIKCNSYLEITEEFVKRLNTERVGAETARTNVKIGTGKLKRQYRIRRIVHVVSKSSAKQYESENLSRIDFTHRFLVRGHWRRIEPGKLGKNRNGDYCVLGSTWVSEFEKGPETAPLISKTRLVD